MLEPIKSKNENAKKFKQKRTPEKWEQLHRSPKVFKTKLRKKKRSTNSDNK